MKDKDLLNIQLVEIALDNANAEYGTKKELFEKYPTICYAGVKSNLAPIKDNIACNQLSVKKWVSVESLWEWIENNKHLPKDKMMNKFVNELPV